MAFIKSPLNYTGNKFRILPQIQPYFPKKIDVMVDLFCGGATVGINTKGKKNIFVDSNQKIIELLEFLANCDFCDLLFHLEKLVSHYGLSYSARDGYSFYKKQIAGGNTNNGLKDYNSRQFYELRADYNSLYNKQSQNAFQMLYLLMVYAFNNDIRFSHSGLFNLPAGKTDLNKSNILKLKAYIERMKSIKCQFVCAQFNCENVKTFLNERSFVYMDPPYLLGNAVYNESEKWQENNERAVLELMDFFLQNSIPFVLSNVLEKKGKKNEPLCNWTLERQNEVSVVDINYHYRSASYNKKNRDANEREVIIFPKKQINDLH